MKEMSHSPLQQARLLYRPMLPKALHKINSLITSPIDTHFPLSSHIASLFPNISRSPPLVFTAGNKKHPPLRVGVVLSGGQAPGGHNVITGLYDALKVLNKESILIGFLNGPGGIVADCTLELTEQLLAGYRNQGGFDLIGSGRDKIETAEQFAAAEKTARKHHLDGLVVIGGDDSNTNAALLAEYFAARQCRTTVVGVPKTIDGDLKSDAIEVSFGFDTASKHYSETIGSLMRDALSAKKYYYFVKLMGRSASHITLECALQTHPNLAFISEEVAAEKKSLRDLIDAICDLICARASKEKDYGVILIPEGLIEFIPEVKHLIEELNGLLSPHQSHNTALEQLRSGNEKVAYIEKWLSKGALAAFSMLPKETQAQLLIGRDPHGNVQVSKIETERMIIDMVKSELKERKNKGAYKGSFSPISHFCGYEGRSCLPSNFDSQYCYSLGYVAAVLIENGANGYICSLKHLDKPVEEWIPMGIPLTSLMTVEQRHGQPKPVIQKALVDLHGKPFGYFKRQRKQWEEQDEYANPGPIQFFGPPDLTEAVTITLALEAGS